MKKKNPTLRDVAKVAGVAVGTVSNYLNKPDTVKEKNRLEIEEAIRKLNYSPNTMAQRLAKGQSSTILLYILSENAIGSSTWLHQLPMIQTINDYLQNTKYALHIKIGGVDKPEYACEYLMNCIASKTIDGVAILSAWEVSRDIIMTFLHYDFPFVLLENENLLTHDSDIIFDNQKMVEDVVDYLYKKGHRKIGFINVDSSQQHIRKRMEGYFSGMKRNNLPILDKWIMEGDFSIESGYACMSRLLSCEQIPTAIVAGNDNMAVGAIKAITEKGYRVPQDISVVGIDNSIVSQACVPELTTMEIPLKQVGETAIRQLLLRMEDRRHTIMQTVYECRLVERLSVTSPTNSFFK